MAEAALADYKNVPLPRQVKISSKRQITIPVDIYNRCGFSEYALLTETPKGLVIEPLDLTDGDERLTIALLKSLMDSGLEGDALLERYAEIKPKFISYHRAIEQSEADIEAGRMGTLSDMQQRMKDKHGLRGHPHRDL